MKSKFLPLAGLLILLFSATAIAGGNELAYKRINELDVLAAGSVDTAADYIPVWDASANKTKRVIASAGLLGDGITSSAAELNYNDITTLGTGAASKSIVLDASGDYTYPASATIIMPSGGTETFQSGSTLNVAGTFQIGGVSATSTAAELNYTDVTTLGTLAASKAWTSDASLDTIMPTGGLLTVQSGAALTLDSGSTLTVQSVAVDKNVLSLQGRATISICGDLVTINNNTVYYGPSAVLLTQSGQTCDTTAAGNTTEATADEPGFVAKAFQVLSMDCRAIAPGGTVSFTLRSAAAATTPSVTCSMTTAQTDCQTSAGTTTAIASGATIAIAAASTSDIGSTKGFRCNLQVAY